ncbi:unnamed protein product [Owenia fusiformis]|uniref:G-protein coupled receptors family 1 profile domain-containing protein n=1 Tax=Owenia fusiformis TaxID=6347 RepID=A0A8S4MWM9_OWEFU|nr:unnamed protein product [Owenia fusiformis]
MKTGRDARVFVMVYFIVIGTTLKSVSSTNVSGFNETNPPNGKVDVNLNISRIELNSTVEGTTTTKNSDTTTETGNSDMQVNANHSGTTTVDTISLPNEAQITDMANANEDITKVVDGTVTVNVSTTVKPIKMFKLTYKYFMSMVTKLAKLGIIKFYTFKIDNDTIDTVTNDTKIIIKWSEYVELIRTLYLKTPNAKCTPPVGDPVTGLKLPFADHARVMQIYVAASICAIGAVSNILAYIALSRQKQNTSVFTMRCLAVSDCIYLMWNGLWEVLYWIYGHTYWMDKSVGARSHHISLAYPYVSTVGYMLQMTSVWLVVLVTVDRFVAVCFPLRAVSLCTIFRARVLCLSVFIMSIIYHIPMFFEWKMAWARNMCSRKFEYVLRFTDTGENFYYQLIYGFILNLMFKNVVPILIVFILNIMLIRDLYRAKRARMEIQSGANTHSRQERDITMTLLSVSTILVICLIPRLALKGMRLVLWIPKTNEERIAQFGSLEAYDNYYWSSNYLFIASVFLMRANSAVNFFIYCIVRKDFRKELRDIFTCNKKKASKAQTDKSARLSTQGQGTKEFRGELRKGEQYIPPGGSVNVGFSSTDGPNNSTITTLDVSEFQQRAAPEYGESVRL